MSSSDLNDTPQTLEERPSPGAEPSAGSTLGTYRVLSELGRGGMGVA